MTYEMQKAYAEVYEILHQMPQEYIRKIPKKIIEMLEKEKLKNYEIELNKENLVDASRLTKTTMTILAMFQYQYWCPNKKIKQELYQIYLKNEEIYQKELREKYNPNEIFKEKKLNQPREELQIVPYKESIFTKLREFIQRIFHKNKTH